MAEYTTYYAYTTTRYLSTPNGVSPGFDAGTPSISPDMDAGTPSISPDMDGEAPF
jgi:hypothetical protein